MLTDAIKRARPWLDLEPDVARSCCVGGRGRGGRRGRGGLRIGCPRERHAQLSRLRLGVSRLGTFGSADLINSLFLQKESADADILPYFYTSLILVMSGSCTACCLLYHLQFLWVIEIVKSEYLERLINPILHMLYRLPGWAADFFGFGSVF
jgi:hypothetical protein